MHYLCRSLNDNLSQNQLQDGHNLHNYWMDIQELDNKAVFYLIVPGITFFKH